MILFTSESFISIFRGFPGGSRTSLVAQMVKRLSTMRETWVRSLGQEDPLETEMAIHSSTIAWKIPWTEEPGRLQPMGSQRVRHDWVTSLHWWLRWQRICLQCRRPGFEPWVRKIPWRMEWQLTPGFQPGGSDGQRSYSPWGIKELDMTEWLTLHFGLKY